MRIKIQGKKGGIDVGIGDVIIFNGAVYILMTKKVWGAWYQYNPTISKTEFSRLLKNGIVEMSSEKYKSSITHEEYDKYKIVKEDCNGK